jgi:hypothetical protein
MGLMTSQYRSVAPASINRRMTVQKMVYLTPATGSNCKPGKCAAALDDVSKYGCRLAADTGFKTGECLSLQFENAPPVAAYVVWNQNGKLGCRFGETLDPALFRQITLAAN